MQTVGYFSIHDVLHSLSHLFGVQNIQSQKVKETIQMVWHTHGGIKNVFIPLRKHARALFSFLNEENY